MDLHSSLTRKRAQQNNTGRMEEEGITILSWGNNYFLKHSIHNSFLSLGGGT